MTWQPDSTTAGFIGPNVSPTPLQDDAYDDLLHDLIAGITNISPDLIRPRWQPEPPPRPDISVNWVAFGITEVNQDWLPSTVHVDSGDGFDAFQRFEVNTVLVTHLNSLIKSGRIAQTCLCTCVERSGATTQSALCCERKER
jgi:hypothetical protein